MAKLYFCYAAMNAGKSTLLLQASHNYIERGMRTLLFTSGLYAEDGIGVISSRLGISAEAELYEAGDDLFSRIRDELDTAKVDCVFVDEAQVALREQTLGSGGLMPGRDLATTFSALRPNDLVWNYVQQNYLKGKEPPAFDLLYWNADSTNLPGPMFC